MKSPQQIKKELKKSYSSIAKAFSDSRARPWPEFDLIAEFIPEDCKLLDLGCGNGRFYAYLTEQLKKRIDYTGVDFCPELIEIAQKRYPKQDFIVQDITELDLNRRFDCIVSFAAFHHIPSRKLRKKALRLLFEHLEDDGVLILSVWNLWQLRYAFQHMKAIFRWIFSFFRSDPRDLFIPFGKQKVPRYYHAFLSSELSRLLKKASFRIDHFEVSRHNSIFVCRKHMMKAQSHPALAKGKNLRSPVRNPSAVATSNKA